MRSTPIHAVTSNIGRNSAILLGLSIPVSVALDNILMGLIAICWLAGGDWRNKTQTVRDNPAAIAALVLYGALCIGAGYAGSDAGVLLKYIDMLMIPAFIYFFRDETTRRRALVAFAVAVLASVMISYVAHMDLLVDFQPLRRTTENPTGFKNSITHNIIVALGAYLFALLALQEKQTQRRIVFAALALLAAHNVIFMVFGRTGYLVAAALLVYIALTHFGRRGFGYVIVAIAAVFSAAYATSETFHQRIDAAAHEASIWHSGEPSATSIGLRLEWYTNSLRIIRDRPLAGSGTGSFPAVYARAVEGSGMVATVNPHNEYLLIAVQIGVIGLACLLNLWWQQWRFAASLAPPLYRHLARGLVITFVIGCLFNSLLIDHTEGLLFAWLTGLCFSAAAPAGEIAS